MTWVSLILQFKGANEIKDFRSISMVGCLYEVISKILANKLKMVISGVVGEAQSAFVIGCQILDEALMACESVHWLKKIKKLTALIKLYF